MKASRSALLSGLALVGAARCFSGRGVGATVAERSMPIAGDTDIADPEVELTHAITIRASADRIWPWLAQMGYDRGGWYTPPWVDKLWGVSNPSADTVIDALQGIGVGDVILDGPPGTATFQVRQCAPPTTLVLWSIRHPIHGRPPNSAGDPALEFTWAFQVVESGSISRLLIRTRGRARPWWVSVAARALFAPIDAFMAASMLRGIRRRVEDDSNARKRPFTRPLSR